MSRVSELFETYGWPSETEMLVFIRALQDHMRCSVMHAMCWEAKSMHPKAANRWPILKVVDLYITFLYAKRMHPLLNDGAGPPQAAVTRRSLVRLGSILDQDTYVWQFLFLRLATAALFLAAGSDCADLDESQLLVGERDAEFTLLNRIGSLFKLPWFRRIWVIQEVALNPNVYARHANITLPWEVIGTCAGMAQSYLSNLMKIRVQNSSTSILDPIRRAPSSSMLPEGRATPWDIDLLTEMRPEISLFWFNGRNRHLKICELLRNVSAFEATVLRDRLYAIYHLAADLPNLGFVPDYGQPLQATFATFTLQVIKATGSLQILLYAARRSAPKTWTWVPEYHQISWRSIWRSTWSLPSDSASLWSQARLYKSIYTLAEEAIVLRGVHFANVSCIVQPQIPFSFPALWKSLLQWHECICRKPARTCMDDHSEGTKLSVTDFLDVLLRQSLAWLRVDKDY